MTVAPGVVLPELENCPSSVRRPAARCAWTATLICSWTSCPKHVPDSWAYGRCARDLCGVTSKGSATFWRLWAR